MVRMPYCGDLFPPDRDTEVSDNTYRDGASHLNNTEASFVEDGGVSVDQRKMNAVRAYFEWMPIRQVEMDDNLRIWRNFQLGNLVDIIMLDTRQYDRSITDLYWNTPYIKAISNDAGRSMMGSRQENWFYNSLVESKERGAEWRIIGSQTGMYSSTYPGAQLTRQFSLASTSLLPTGLTCRSTTMLGMATPVTATARSRPCTSTTLATTS
jgi:phosphodiesterase/alkaline phosphatase D-like protein